ncbi:ethanolamine utilization polyhedral-body-like protein EutM [Klebsiella pneumoniae]|nr:ethanolamine utilization polyhedral-body-like protein EutM [Klebsiella pneumoniae]
MGDALGLIETKGLVACIEAADAADLSAQYRDLHLLAAGIFPLRDLRHPAEGRFYAVG